MGKGNNLHACGCLSISGGMTKFSSGFWDMFQEKKSCEMGRRDPLDHFFGLRGPKIDKVRAFFVRYFLGPLGVP